MRPQAVLGPTIFVGTLVIWALVPTPVMSQVHTEISEEVVGVRFWLRDVELVTVVQAVGRYLDRPVLIDPQARGIVPFFETPSPVPRDQLIPLLRGLVRSLGYDLHVDSAFLRVLAPGPGRPPPSRVVDLEGRPHTPGSRTTLHAVQIQHAVAEDIAATLNQLFGGGGEFNGSGALISGETIPADRVHASSPPLLSGTLSGDVTIVPDEASNQVLMRGDAEDFAVLENAIAQLDVRPMQVLIEVVVAEARKDRRFELGLSAAMTDYGYQGTNVSGEMFGAGLGDLVVRVMGLGPAEVNVMLSAARLRGDVTIRSRPVLIAANNTEAHILVGTQQPFVQVSRSLPTDTPQRDQVVQYRDVGTKLTVTPTINPEGFVSLQIQQEMSQATGETQFDAPIISSRQTATRVLVDDGQTIVLGGLTDRIVDQVRTGVPLLMDIPLLGGLFGSTKARTTETELFVFITPTILHDRASADAVTRGRLPDDLIPGDSMASPDSIRSSHR